MPFLRRSLKTPSRILASVIFLFASIAEAVSETPQRPLVFDGKGKSLFRPWALQTGHFNGNKRILIIEASRDRRCVLDIPVGCVVDDLKLHVRQGAELTITGAMLRRCQIYAEPKSTVIIQDSGLEQCELNGHGESDKGFPLVKMVNTIFADSAFLRPVNALGLDMFDCLLLDVDAPARSPKAVVMGDHSFPEQSRNPRIRYTAFRNSYINPTLFYTTSHCTFEDCTTLAEPITGGEDEGSPPRVTLPIRWRRGLPGSIPILGGGVALQQASEPFPGSCSLKFTWAKGALSIKGAAPSIDSRPLDTVLPGETDWAAVEQVVAVSDSAPAAVLREKPTQDPVKLRLTRVNGLLVMPLSTGKMAGQVSRMHLTATPMRGPSVLTFNQPVGTDMSRALGAVTQFSMLRHKEYPAEMRLEISFEEKYSDKDGPSAAVPCALLVESAMTGKIWDPAFAVTGDLNSDGSVQPIGGVAAKVRGATNGSCTVIAVPAKNEAAVADVLVADGPGPLVGISIFAIKEFDEAVALADPERAAPLQEALQEMASVRAVLMRDPRAMPMTLKTPQAAARLQSILHKAPNCLSAKYLLQYSQGRGPVTFTIGGSIEATDSSAMALVAALKNTSASTVNSMKSDDLGSTLNRLKNLRPKIDKRVWPYLDSMVDYGELIRTALVNPATVSGGRFEDFSQKLQLIAKNITATKVGLLADPTVQEELGL